jgi:FecR protein/Putative zinc-finger
MNEKHYQEKLSAFVNHELPQTERQAIAEHLLRCAVCRHGHDEIKLGAALASQLKSSDAPANLWNKIENALDGKGGKTKVFLFPNFAFVGSRSLLTAAGLLIICGLIGAIYFGFLRNNSPETVKNETPTRNANVAMPEVISTSHEILANQKTNAAIQVTETNSSIQTASKADSNISIQPRIADANVGSLPVVTKKTLPARPNLPSWNVETIAGTPKIGDSFENGKLAVGQFLETDASSRARVQVANIGQVEISPNSRIQLVGTKSTEHRLSLERGILQAKILAPPRLFIVDTPSAVAVDLGCEYTLEVDREGNSKLHVTGGFVALEKGGRESIVPAGATALTKKGKGIGTPFADDSSAELQNALYQFDFGNGGEEALQTIIKEANLYDALTLWHLLSRVSNDEREKVFDALAAHVKPPTATTKQGVLRLDKKMLAAWWKEIENVRFG